MYSCINTKLEGKIRSFNLNQCKRPTHKVTHTVRIHSNPLDPLLGRLALDYIDEDDLSLRLSDLFKVL
jgi:hypothetical protein